jgi:hypothetical protein
VLELSNVVQSAGFFDDLAELLCGELIGFQLAEKFFIIPEGTIA